MKKFTFDTMVTIGNDELKETLKNIARLQLTTQAIEQEPKANFVEKTFTTFYLQIMNTVAVYFRNKKGCPTNMSSKNCIKIYDKYINCVFDKDMKKFLMETN